MSIKTKIISIFLATLLLFSFSGFEAIRAISSMKGEKQRVERVSSKGGMADNSSSLGDGFLKDYTVKTYKSEAEYNEAKQVESKEENKINSTISNNATQTVEQKIIIKDKRTEVKIKNATIYVNNIKYSSDVNGELILTERKNKILSIRVEMTLYISSSMHRPATGNDIIIHLKKENADVMFNNVVLKYGNKNVNLIEDSCFLNKDLGNESTYTEIKVEDSTAYEEYDLYVNGEFYAYSSDGSFLVDAADFSPNDKFSIQAIDQGIVSDMYDLKLSIGNKDSLLQNLSSAEGGNINQDLESELDFGIFCGVSFGISEALSALLTPIIDKNTISGEGKVNINFNYDTDTGIIEFATGFTFQDTLSKEDTVKYNNAKKVIINNKQAIEAYKIKRKELNNKLKQEKNNNIQDKDKIKRIQDEITALHNNVKENIKSNNEAQKACDDIKSYCNNEYKDVLSEMKDIMKKANGNPKAAFQNIKSYFGNRLNQKIKPFEMVKSRNFSVDFSFGGVVEYSTIEKKVIEFDLVANAEAKLSYEGQFWVPVTVINIPVFYRIELSAGIGINVKIIEDGKPISLSDFFKRIYLTFALKATGELGLGIGIGDVRVGISGFASLEFNGEGHFEGENKLRIACEGNCEFELGAKIYYLISETTISHKFGPIKLFGNEKSNVGEVTKTNETQLMKRQRSITKNLSSDRIIMDNEYQASTPKITKLGDKTIMTWIEDSADRDNYNFTRLMYAIYEDGKWSIPQAVADDGMADFYQDVYSDGVNLYVTWQKVNKKLTEYDNFSMYSSSIMVSKFDSNKDTFSSATTISDNEGLNALPTFSMRQNCTDPIAVVWVKNLENNLIGSSGTNSIYYSELKNNNWSEQKIACKENKILTGITSTYENNQLKIIYSVDEDNDIFTLGNQVKSVAACSTPQVLNDLDGADNLKYSMVEGKPTLTYYNKNKVLCEYYNDKELGFIDGINGDYEIANDGNMIYYTKQLDNNRKQGYCAVYDETGWTKDILLTNESESVTAISGIVSSNGEIMSVYNIHNNDGKTAICMDRKNLETSIKIKNAIVTKIYKDQYKLTFELINNGNMPIEEIIIDCFGKNKVIHLGSLLEANQAAIIEIYYDKIDEINSVTGILHCAQQSNAFEPKINVDY